MSESTQKLSDAGVSIWLDDLSRERLTSGNLAELIKTHNVVGVTTNPTIFAGALSKGAAYAEQMRELAAAGADVEEAVFAATCDDVRNACDVFAPIYNSTNGLTVASLLRWIPAWLVMPRVPRRWRVSCTSVWVVRTS